MMDNSNSRLHDDNTHDSECTVSAENLSGLKATTERKSQRFNERDVRMCACAEDNTTHESSEHEMRHMK